MYDNNQMAYSVKLSKIAEMAKLRQLNPEVKADRIYIHDAGLNRPALQLAGFFDFFDNSRIQLIGKVEQTYIEQVYDDGGTAMIKKIFGKGIPAMIYCRNIQPTQEIIELGTQYNVAIYSTEQHTTQFTGKLIHILNEELAPRISIHGVLVDVYGEGVLILGESGIGKSETALELIKRGHRLISDDVVEIKLVGDELLFGRAPDITRHFIELRGIGIIDVRSLFGVNSVKESQSIDLVIKLEEWDREKEYDRLGLEDKYTEFLGRQVVCHSIPIRPGRNLALIVEAAAVNYRQKQMGYNAAHELYRRATANLQKKHEDQD